MRKLTLGLALLLLSLLSLSACDIFVQDTPDTVVVDHNNPDVVVVEDQTPDVVVVEDKTPDVDIHVDTDK